MTQLILVPQAPVPMRYQWWFATAFPKQLRRRFNMVVVLGEKQLQTNKYKYLDNALFSPIRPSITFELRQIQEYMDLPIEDDDILLLMDISFPGLFPNVLYHNRPKNCFAYCHATACNNLDYFEKDRDSKFSTETAHSQLFTKIFVATRYHKDKLGWDNVEVIGLPKPLFRTYENEEKKYDVISVARPCEQKVTLSLEKLVEETFGKIERRQCNTWDEYYRFLSSGKVLLSTAREETFGYSVLEATLNNCIPICPSKLSFPELLPREYLYDDAAELIDRIQCCLDGKYEVPKLLNTDLIENFYDNLSGKMKENSSPIH